MPDQTHPVAASRLTGRPLAVLAAVAVAVATWAVMSLAGLELTARTGPGGDVRPVGLISVFTAALVAGLAAWALLALLARLTRAAAPIWRTVAVVVLVLSMAGPLTSGTGAASSAGLAVLHLVVGVVLIVLLPRQGGAAGAPPVTPAAVETPGRRA